MSYDLELVDPITKQTLVLEERHHMRGGTYCVGGETHARFNITYNYAKHYYRVFPKTDRAPHYEWMKPKDPNDGYGLRTIYGLTGAESIPVLQEAISKLGDDVAENYWEGTEGNAKRALLCLLALARMRPDGIWEGD